MLAYQNCGTSHFDANSDPGLQAFHIKSANDSVTDPLHEMPTPSPTPDECANIPDTQTNERFNAVYTLLGPNANPDARSLWGIYETTYKGLKAWVGCGGNYYQNGQYATACQADCNFLVTYDCKGRAKKMQQNNGQVACFSASLQNFTTGNWSQLPLCKPNGSIDYVGQVCTMINP